MKKLTKIMVILLSLVLVVGCFSLFAACGDDDTTTPDNPDQPVKPAQNADRVVALPMPQVSDGWVGTGINGASDTSIVGGVTAGWAVTNKGWGDGTTTEAKAAAAFVNFMTTAEVIDPWAGDDSINPVKGSTQQGALALAKAFDVTKYSSIKMALKPATLALDAIIDNTTITAIRAIVGATADEGVSAAFDTAITGKESYTIPAYTAPTKAETKIPLADADLTARISVFTMYGKGDWQNASYQAGLAAFKTAFPNVQIDETNIAGVDNSVKDQWNNNWGGNADGMPDVISWFSDASAKVLQDDAHLTAVATIQAKFGNYAENVKENYINKYFLPIVGTYETMFTNVKMLADLGVIEAGLLTTLDTARDAVLTSDLEALTGATENATTGALTLTFAEGTASDVQARVQAMADAQVAVYNAAAGSVSTWDKLAAVAGKAVTAKKNVFAQDSNNENNYLVDQAVMLMAGKAGYLADIKSLTTEQNAAWDNAFKLINKMNTSGWFNSSIWTGNHEGAKTAFKGGNALFMIEGSWSRWALGYEATIK